MLPKEQRYQQFREDMEDAGFDVEDYGGRNYYEGPAVRIEQGDLQNVIRSTSVKLQWDQLGLGLIVYPV